MAKRARRGRPRPSAFEACRAVCLAGLRALERMPRGRLRLARRSWVRLDPAGTQAIMVRILTEPRIAARIAALRERADV